MGIYNSPTGCWATFLRRGALPAVAGFVFYLGLVSGPGRGIAEIQAAGTKSPDATKNIQEAFGGARKRVPCHQNIYDKYSKTRMAQWIMGKTADLLPERCTSR